MGRDNERKNRRDDIPGDGVGVGFRYSRLLLHGVRPLATAAQRGGAMKERRHQLRGPADRDAKNAFVARGDDVLAPAPSRAFSTAFPTNAFPSSV